jgi:hypothetical protein
MAIPATYLWQTVYLAAVLETDNAAMPTRIYEALAAIEQRCLSPIEAGDVEDRAIEDAQRGLLALKAERTEGSVPEVGFSIVQSNQAEPL